MSKVIFLIRGRYPTEKAYGITTSAMIRELDKIHFDVVVWSLEGESGMSDKRIKSYQLNLFSKNLIKYARLNSRPANILAWKMAWKMIFWQNRHRIRAENALVIWTRDFLVPKYLLNKKLKQQTVIEIHELPKFPNFNKSRKLRNVTFAPISQILLGKVSEFGKSSRVIFSPMGIDKELLASDNEIARYCHNIQTKENLVAAYVGKLNPGGYSKGYEKIFQLLENPVICITIAGYLSNEESKLESALKKFNVDMNRVSTIPHTSHPEALSIMRKSDILVLTSPDSEKYVGYPIKALEYLATGKIVLVEDSKILRDVFNSDFQPYWFDPKNKNSINDSLGKALNDSILQERLIKGRNFAAEHLWVNRLNNIVESLDI